MSSARIAELAVSQAEKVQYQRHPSLFARCRALSWGRAGDFGPLASALKIDRRLRRAAGVSGPDCEASLEDRPGGIPEPRNTVHVGPVLLRPDSPLSSGKLFFARCGLSSPSCTTILLGHEM